MGTQSQLDMQRIRLENGIWLDTVGGLQSGVFTPGRGYTQSTSDDYVYENDKTVIQKTSDLLHERVNRYDGQPQVDFQAVVLGNNDGVYSFKLGKRSKITGEVQKFGENVTLTTLRDTTSALTFKQVRRKSQDWVAVETQITDAFGTPADLRRIAYAYKKALQSDLDMKRARPLTLIQRRQRISVAGERYTPERAHFIANKSEMQKRYLLARPVI